MLAIVGGASLPDEGKFIDKRLDIVDEIMFAGGISLGCLAALGHKTGATLMEPCVIPMARKLLSKAQMLGVTVHLPVDFLMGDILVNADGVVESSRPPGEDDGEEEEEEEEEPEENDEEIDEAAGFDYEGEVCSRPVHTG